MPPAAPEANPVGPRGDAPLTAALREGARFEAIVALLAFLDLAVSRVGVRLVEPNARELWMPLLDAGELIRNLTASFGIVVLLVELRALMAAPIVHPLRGLALRTALAASAGLYLPSLFLALARSRATLHGAMLGVGVIGASALVFVVGLSSLRARRSAPGRISLLAGLLSALGLIGFFVELFQRVARSSPPAIETIHAVTVLGGELVWALAPLLLLLGASHRRALGVSVSRAPWRGALGLLAFGLTLGFFLWLRAAFRVDAARILYAASRLSALDGGQLWLYGLPLGLTLALATASILHRPTRGLGAALVLWVAAGPAPRSPATLLFAVLAALLFARVARGAPQGEDEPAASTRLASS